jgi:hypothetical protein
MALIKFEADTDTDFCELRVKDADLPELLSAVDIFIGRIFTGMIDSGVPANKAKVMLEFAVSNGIDGKHE